jgi:hydroxymethylpyrimidine/phosphomethylpyrimidine kinase
MRLNHVTLPAHDYAASCAFYERLGLRQIVAAPPRYARFEMMPGETTLSIEVMEGGGRAGAAEIYLACADVDAEWHAATARGLIFDFAPQDETYLWRRAGLTDPAGNRIFLYTAGRNHRFPPWRIDGQTGDG